MRPAPPRPPSAPHTPAPLASLSRISSHVYQQPPGKEICTAQVKSLQGREMLQSSSSHLPPLHSFKGPHGPGFDQFSNSFNVMYFNFPSQFTRVCTRCRVWVAEPWVTALRITNPYTSLCSLSASCQEQRNRHKWGLFGAGVKSLPGPGERGFRSREARGQRGRPEGKMG